MLVGTRVCPTVGAGFQRRPDVGFRNSPFCWRLVLPCAAVPPHFFGLAQRNGVEPQRKALGWWRPREVSGPARLSHSRGRCHSAAKVSASRTDWITRPRGEGFGSDVDWRLKVFCPAFLQKSGRGPGAEPLAARRSARNAPMLTKRRRGSKGEPPPGVPPLRAAPPPAVPARCRSAGGKRTPGGGWNAARRAAFLLLFARNQPKNLLCIACTAWSA